MGVNSGGRDWSSRINWDNVGKVYAAMIVGWTVILTSGMIWLVIHRRVHFIRMRNLPLMFCSAACLHVYLVKMFLAYTINGNFPCSGEFWIMSLYLPFGIALFQANITQLRRINEQQERILHHHMSWSSSSSGSSIQKSVTRRWRSLTVVQKDYLWIGIGMFLQLIVTAILFATSPVLLGDWSSFGLVTVEQGQALCRKTLHWVPSAFWQLFWSWIWGPYMLFKIKDIRDTHHWRLQVILTVVAGLPGAPMWLATLFTQSNIFSNLNKFFIPSMWLSPGIMIMQFVTIFFPIYEFWEDRRAVRGVPHYAHSGSRIGGDLSSQVTPVFATDLESLAISTSRLFAELAVSGAGEGRNMYRIAALERALVINPMPLLSFAATRDFSAENIVFLISVRAWRKAWQDAPRSTDPVKIRPYARLDMLKWAVEIYTTSIDPMTAEIPVNIDAAIFKGIESKLGIRQTSVLVSTLPEASNEKDQLETIKEMPSSDELDVQDRIAGQEASWSSSTIARPFYNLAALSELVTSCPRLWMRNHLPSAAVAQESIVQVVVDRIPQDFDEHVFDAAESSVKLLVLLNTWRKFVKEQKDKLEEKLES